VNINNEGMIENHHGGNIILNQVLDLRSTGTLLNNGFITSYLDDDDHIVDGTFENNGVIDDNHNTFPNTVDNQKLIITPLTEPMYEGVPYSDVLEVVSLNGLTIGDWKVSQNGAVAGTYNEATNEFTPNSNAIGVSTIYISIHDDVSGVGRNFTLEVDGGVLPFTGNNNSAFIQNNQDGINPDFQTESVDVFPNPTTGSIQMESEMFESNKTNVQVFNALGQLVQQAQLGQGDFVQRFDFSSELTSGIYFVKIFQKGKEVSVERVQLQR